MSTVLELLHDASDIQLNGLVYRIVLIDKEQTSLTIPSNFYPYEAEGLRATLPIFTQVAQIVTGLNERLLDPLDGYTNRGIEILLNAQSTTESFRQALIPYAFACFKNGTNAITERGCVLVPPAPRRLFEAEIQALPAQDRGGFPWRRWLDHLFLAVPKITQGFYLFENESDFRRFEQSLGPNYSDLCDQIMAIFDRAIETPSLMDRGSWETLDKLSQQVMELQRAAIEQAIAASPPSVLDVTTRARARFHADGSLRFDATHFAIEFRQQLRDCATQLRRAQELLPIRCTEIRRVIEELAAWCCASDPDDTWGESREVWLAASSANNVIDLNFTAEEKVSRVGVKGSLQFLLCAFEQVPEAIAPAYEAVRREAQRHNLNVLFLRHLVVGGGASNWTLAGEKLPDPKGRPQYKVMTFTNAVKASHVRGNGPLIIQATEWPENDLDRMADAVTLHVLLHEYGHTLGDFAEFLGDLGSSVEETNAEASAIYQASRLAPEYLRIGVIYGACWTPVLRTMQGPSEAHSHSDITLFGEYEAQGAVQVIDLGDRKVVRAVDTERVAQIAFTVAMRMRMWEAGLARNEHSAITEDFDSKDCGQDERIYRRAMKRLADLSEVERRQMKQLVIREVRQYFAPEELERAARPLREVIASLPKYQALSVIPSDRRIAALFANTHYHEQQ